MGARKRTRRAVPAKTRWWGTRLAPWLVLLLGGAASFSAAANRDGEQRKQQREQFQTETDDVLDSLATTARGYEVVVNGIQGLLIGDPDATRDEFRALTDSLLVGDRFPGIFGAAWTQSVPAEQVPVMRDRCVPELPGLAPDPANGAAFVVAQAEPETISIARCIDAALFPEIKGVLEAARDKGVLQISDRFDIPTNLEDQAGDLQTGFMLVKPVYASASVPGTLAERRKQIRGWAGIMVNGEVFIPLSSGDAGYRYKIELFDGDTTKKDALLAVSDMKAGTGGRRRTTSIELYGHLWTVRMSEVHAAPKLSREPLMILISGMSVTVLLFALVLVMVRSEKRALRMVDEATLELSRQERQFRALVANATELITVAGDDGLLRYVSPASERLLGYEQSELIGRDLMEYVHPDDSDHIVREIADNVLTQGVVGPLDFRVRHRDGSWRYLEALGLNLLEDPAVEGIIFNCRDVTERKAFEHDLSFQATHDPLTGLPNRTLLLDRLGQALARATRTDRRPAVLFIDLDRFKFVNDSLGHGAGDRLLAKVAERVRHAVRPGDTVARFGGDEFVVLAEGIEDVAECGAIAERLTSTLAAPFNLSGHEVFVTASIGLRLARGDHETPETILRDADAAMYRAKEQGRARTEWFDEQTHWRSVDRLAIENALHRALDRDELRLHYQPQYELATGRALGVEALLRWHHPERGLVGPGEFIELAEDTGLIVPIGEWVVREACRQGERWRRQLPADMPFVVSANLSARQLAQPDLVEVLARVLHDTGFAPESLCLEITEGALMQDVTTTVHTLHSLKALGVKLAIDDFGTGYASLGHLKRFPVDSLKIDRAFVDGLGLDPDDQVIVAAVIGLAHALGITAVAEGVETHAQLAELRALRCDAAQGYLFARPVEAAALGDLAPVSLDQPAGGAAAF